MMSLTYGLSWNRDGAGLEGLEVGDLLILRDAAESLLQTVEARLDELAGESDSVLGDTDPPTGQGITPNGPGGRRRGRGWVELKMIRGYGPYAYERWYEGGKKRSRYLGKVKA